MWWQSRTALIRCPLCREAVPASREGWDAHRDGAHTVRELFAYGWGGPHRWVFRTIIVMLTAFATVMLAATIGAARPFTVGSVTGLGVFVAVTGVAVWHNGACGWHPRIRAAALALIAGATGALGVVAAVAGGGVVSAACWAVIAVAAGKAAVTSWRYRRPPKNGGA